MKPSRLSAAACLLFLLGSAGPGLAVLLSGCAASPTRESTGEIVDDSAITAKVKVAFVRDDTVKASQVTVETFKGVVQLSGFVDTPEQKSRAGFLAANVPGVREVKNHITVK